MININDNEQTITCRICGENHRRLYGNHFKYSHDGLTATEYRKMFPGAPITVPDDMKNTTKNGGKHMQTEKYKKMFSDMFSGEKNPNHKNNTTEQDRKERSPSCIEFYNKKYPDLTQKQRQNMLDKHVKEKVKDRLLPSNVEYWINKGYSEEESKIKVSESQTTFSKEICIQKYGYEKGIEIFNNRTEKWRKSLNENGNLKNGYSLISQELFYEIKNRRPGDYRYATNGGEFGFPKDSGGVWLYDFTDIDNKKIIEYQGDIYHANPTKYNESDRPHPFRKGETSSEIWEKDKIKLSVAKNNGYDILYIWDSEFSGVGHKKKELIIKKCIDFLNG